MKPTDMQFLAEKLVNKKIYDNPQSPKIYKEVKGTKYVPTVRWKYRYEPGLNQPNAKNYAVP